ncbi:hypothetical protein [Tardiphaga sp. vice278]|uniref:hypothetical protein n=1 Tax=Tardiphaga sp. vice278 TaxID=2592815 RepID=UPI001161E137|nr:hypothetical protein [Tardiphaga sp. vice278]QDM17542.1 hypothetical protein FNL53_17540 [Tardiphaga sp. vice278]
MADPWAFGWTQLLTIAGLLITISIAVSGFRTFGRWKREKVEELRIETAIEALAVAYESKFVFQHIRGALVEGHEWSGMERRPGHNDTQHNSLGSFYAVLERIKSNRDFFEHLWKMQPKCMAIFGPQIEDTFMLVHKSRRHVEVACQMLSSRINDGDAITDETRKLYDQLRRDMSDHGDFEPEKDRVGKMLQAFIVQMEASCRPIIDKTFKPNPAFS